MLIISIVYYMSTLPVSPVSACVSMSGYCLVTMSWCWYRCPGQWPLMSRCQGMMEKISSQFVHYRHHSLYHRPALLISAARESYNVIMLRYVDCYVIDLEPGSCVRIETTRCATPRLVSLCSGPDITIIILPWTGATSFE